MRRVTQLLLSLRQLQTEPCTRGSSCWQLLSILHSQAGRSLAVASLATRQASQQASPLGRSTQPATPPLARSLLTAANPGPPAFVFDIDGVLIRGKQVLDAAKAAMAKVYQPGGQAPRYPVCFLTNGGGYTEAKKAEQLSGWLGVHVRPDQVVLSHTPFRQLVPRLGRKPVLILGHGDVPHVAKRYGFRHSVTTHQLAAAMGSMSVPFKRRLKRKPKSGPVECQGVLGEKGFGSDHQPFAAVLVFTDPIDWYQDLQLATDVIMAGGVPLRRPTEETVQQSVEVFFSNGDLLWANEHPVARLGQGAFAACMQALHEKLTGKPLPCVKFFGKPHAEPYELIQTLLSKQAQALGLMPPADFGQQGELPFSGIYMVGDNPKADVRGARLRGAPWVPVLVRTGVFHGSQANDPEDPADIVVDDVAAAIDAALHRTRSATWHSLR